MPPRLTLLSLPLRNCFGLIAPKVGNLYPEAARLLALEIHREDKVSLERAAELCHTPLAAFAAKHGVPPLRCNYEDLEEERRSTDRLET